MKQSKQPLSLFKLAKKVLFAVVFFLIGLLFLVAALAWGFIGFVWISLIDLNAKRKARKNEKG